MAVKENMYVMQGIGMTKDSALYFDDDYKNKMREEVANLAETFKNDTSIIAWGIGNEINLGKANIPEAWQFVEELAKIIKSIDTRHLVSTVISHSAKALNMVAKYAPSLDFVGINSYGSIVHIGDMVKKSDYKGAFMVTEWGPTGFWEMTKTSWGAPIEQTSEEKRVVYEERYKKYILANPRCMGSFVFLWGRKEERTPTWFSMFVEKDVEGLPLNGEKTPTVEAMQRVWTGEEPAQTAPVISNFTLNGKTAADNVIVKAGGQLEASVNVKDMQADKLTYVWEVLKEATVFGFGGSYEPRPDRVGDVFEGEKNTYNIPAKTPGNYRIYVYVLDNTGFVATANIPFRIE